MPFTFLISSERSGSNLITKMFDNHPEFCGPTPSHLIRAFANNRLRYGNIQKTKNWHILTQDIADYLKYQLGKWQTTVSASELRTGIQERSLTALIRYVYEMEAKANHKSRVFVKENQTFHFTPFLLMAFPEAKFIFLVRDPRDMILSWKISPSHPGGVHRGAQVWKSDQARSLELYGYLKDGNKIVLLKYEDLVSRTADELRRVCDFLEVTYAPQMLEFYRNELTVENSERIKGWDNLQRPILVDNFAKYRGELSELEIRYIEALCGPEMAFLGYQPDFPPADDLSTLEGQLLDLEQSTLVKTESLDQKEEEIRANRLAVIERIIHRELWTDSNAF